MKQWIFVFMYIRFLVVVFTIFTFSLAAYAQQWAPVGDPGLRRDVELLKTYDIIHGPVNTWPMSWRQIIANINVSADQSYPAHIMRAIERIRTKMPHKGLRASAIARYTNEPSLVRGFGDTAQSDMDLTLSAGITEEKIEANVLFNYIDHVSGDNVNLDGSYIATNIGNWSLYAGAIDRWWGPGQDNTLLLSSNARPMLSAGFRRINPKSFKKKWLNWIGPWTWDMFLTNMGKNRHVPNTLMVGMRLGIEPFNNFEVGLSRTLQLCGKNRPCGPNMWARALIAIGDLDNTITDYEPGNQLASIDIAHSITLGDKSLRIYAEGTAEDIEFAIPYQYSRLIGATLTAPVGESGENLSFNIELSDSGDVLAWLIGDRRDGVMYGHTIYKTGHRYDGRTLGHSFDNDSKLASLAVTYTKSDGEFYRISIRTATLNWDDTSRNIVSAERQKYQSFEFFASKRFEFGHLDAKMNIQSRAVTLTQGILPRLAAGLTWRIDI